MATRKAVSRKKPAKKTAARRSAAPSKKVVKPIPDGYRSITPYLSIAGAAAAIDFYKRAFGAKERMRMGGPDGKIGHAELVLGDSVVMLADEFAEMGFLSPKSRGGTPVTIHHYVKKVDEMVARAVAAGATIKRPLKNEFYGDRVCTIEDPFGHIWHLATHIEELTKAEMKKRGEALMKAGG